MVHKGYFGVCEWLSCTNRTGMYVLWYKDGKVEYKSIRRERTKIAALQINLLDSVSET